MLRSLDITCVIFGGLLNSIISVINFGCYFATVFLSEVRVVNGFTFSALRHVSLLFSRNPLGTNCNRKNAYFEGKESNRNSYINFELDFRKCSKISKEKNIELRSKEENGRRKNGLEAGCLIKIS